METTTINKAGIRYLKSTIKDYVEKQKFYKDQRKAVHNKGERKMDHREAADKAFWNGVELRILYAAYGLMRGKSFEQTEKRSDLTEIHPLNQWHAKINKTIEGCNAIKEE